VAFGHTLIRRDVTGVVVPRFEEKPERKNALFTMENTSF